MKKPLVLILLGSLLLASCMPPTPPGPIVEPAPGPVTPVDPITPVEPVPPATPTPLTSLSGSVRLADAPQMMVSDHTNEDAIGKTLELHLETSSTVTGPQAPLSSAVIGSDLGYTISLPTPDAATLEPVEAPPMSGGCAIERFELSDVALKTAGGYFTVTLHDENGTAGSARDRVAEIGYQSEQTGNTTISTHMGRALIYADRNAQVLLVQKCSYEGSVSEYLTDFDLKQGWNIVEHISRVEGTTYEDGRMTFKHSSAAKVIAPDTRMTLYGTH